MKLTVPAIYTAADNTHWSDVFELSQSLEIDFYRWEENLVHFLMASREVMLTGMLTVMKTEKKQRDVKQTYAFDDIVKLPSIIYSSSSNPVYVPAELATILVNAHELGVTWLSHEITKNRLPLNAFSVVQLPKGNSDDLTVKCTLGYNKKMKPVNNPNFLSLKNTLQ